MTRAARPTGRAEGRGGGGRAGGPGAYKGRPGPDEQPRRESAGSRRCPQAMQRRLPSAEASDAAKASRARPRLVTHPASAANQPCPRPCQATHGADTRAPANPPTLPAGGAHSARPPSTCRAQSTSAWPRSAFRGSTILKNTLTRLQSGRGKARRGTGRHCVVQWRACVRAASRPAQRLSNVEPVQRQNSHTDPRPRCRLAPTPCPEGGSSARRSARRYIWL